MELVIDKPIDNLLDRLPLDAKREVNKFIAELEYPNQFYDRIGEYDSIEQLQANYQKEMADPFSRDVFIINPKGLGMGEVWIGSTSVLVGQRKAKDLESLFRGSFFIRYILHETYTNI